MGSKKVFVAIFLATIFIIALNPFEESDSFYHLAAGKLIAETKTVPYADVFSYTAAGQPWIAHEWLAELFFYGVYALLGYWGVIVAVALLAALTYALLLTLAAVRGVPLLYVLPSLLIAGCMTYGFWIGRPQVLSYVLLALLLLILERVSRTGSMKLLFFVPLIVGLWANLHGSFPLGVLMPLGYAASAALKLARPRWFGTPSLGERPLPYLAAGGAAAAAALLNPNGAAAFGYLLAVREGVAALHIAEWQSLFYFTYEPWWHVCAVVFLFSMYAGWRWFLRDRRYRDVKDAGLVIGASLLPFLSIRYVALWPLLALPPLLGVTGSMHFRERIKKQFHRAPVIAAIFTILLVAAIFFHVPRRYFHSEAIPVHAANFIEAEKLSGNLFNFYEHGGYFLWRFFPERKIFIDGRSEVFKGTPIKDYAGIITIAPGWQELLQHYEVGFAVVPYSLPYIDGMIRVFGEALLREGWSLVYWDDAAVILIAPGEANAEAISKYAVRSVDPWAEPEKILGESRPAVIAEIKVLLERAPHSERIREYAARLDRE